MIIDAHAHHMPIEVYRQLHDPDAPPKQISFKGNDAAMNARVHRIDEHLRAMDGAGIDMAVLTLSQWNVGGPAMCRAINEGVANLVARQPQRFRAAGSVPVADPEAALAEIDHMIGDLKLSGIALLTSQGQDLTASTRDRMWPIYAKAVEYDVPIFWHPHLLPYGTELDCTINRSVGRGFDISRLILRLIYDVLPAFPTIKMVIPHFGGGFLAHKQRSIAFFEPPAALGIKVPVEIATGPKTPLETEELGFKAVFDDLFDRLYIDGAGSGGWAPITQLAFTAVRHDRLCFGTDYPFETHFARDYRHYLDNLAAMDVSDADKKAFLGGNMARLLKLDQGQAASA